MGVLLAPLMPFVKRKNVVHCWWYSVRAFCFGGLCLPQRLPPFRECQKSEADIGRVDWESWDLHIADLNSGHLVTNEMGHK